MGKLMKNVMTFPCFHWFIHHRKSALDGNEWRWGLVKYLFFISELQTTVVLLLPYSLYEMTLICCKHNFITVIIGS